jgi:hypothetical protein
MEVFMNDAENFYKAFWTQFLFFRSKKMRHTILKTKNPQKGFFIKQKQTNKNLKDIMK